MSVKTKTGHKYLQ